MPRDCGSAAYDPMRHAVQLGVRVIIRPLQVGRWGAYDAQRRTIYLRPGLTARQERAVLAHELAHAEHEDVLTGDWRADARAERRADELAAGRLIDPGALEAELLVHPDDPARVADHLDVPRWLLDVALTLQTERDLGEDAHRAG